MQALRDAMSQIQSHNAILYGISTDTVDSHKRFAEKEGLKFPLLADPMGAAAQAYGVLNDHHMADRVSFVIAPDGRIAGIDRSVNSQFSHDGARLISRHGIDLALLLSNWKARVGGPVPNFSLPGYNGKTVNLFSPGKKAAVVFFLSKNCPVSRAYDDRIRALTSDPAYRDVSFLGVDPVRQETAVQIAALAESEHLDFPIGMDSRDMIAGHFGAVATPTAWVVNGKGIAVYVGAIDNSPQPSLVTHHYLKDALDAAIADRPVAIPVTHAAGCAIKPSRR